MTPPTRTAREVAAELLALAETATPGPWAFAQTAEKGYGANIAASVFAEDDKDCRVPLAGDLSQRWDDYYVDEPLADLSHHRAGPDAALIVAMRNGLALVCRALLDAEQLLGFANTEKWAIAPQCSGGWVVCETNDVGISGDADEGRELARTRGSLTEALTMAIASLDAARTTTEDRTDGR